MTTLPLVLDDEPVGIILRVARERIHPRIWAYCWCADEEEGGRHPHETIPIDPYVNP